MVDLGGKCPGPPEFSKVDDVVQYVQRCLPSTNTFVIGIDGNDGVGKTTLARKLERSIGGQVFSLDCYVVENKGAYVKNLNTTRLKHEIEGLSGGCIIEGVCLRKALRAAEIDADVHVYVKKVATYGYWHDQGELACEEPVDDQIERLKKEVSLFAQISNRLQPNDEPLDESESLTPLREEIIRYHRELLPHMTATCVYLHVESESGLSGE